MHVHVPHTPAEHCGAFPPDRNGDPTLDLATECVLRPGHQGSHANEQGTRWLYRPGARRDEPGS